MPELGPDICYSCQELLVLVRNGDLKLSDFDGESVLSVKADEVLSTCQDCNWISFDRHGRIGLTDTGESIARLLIKNGSSEALRIQINSMVRKYNWIWTTALGRGREEAL